MTEKDGKKQLIGVQAHELHKAIVANEMKRRELLINNIELLDTMQKDKLYQDVLGDNEAEWYAYLGQIDVYYTRSKVVRMLRIKKNLVDKFGIPLENMIDVHETRLENIASLAKTKKQALDLIEDARTLLAADWRETINLLRGRVSRDDCKHDMSVFEMCKNCGEKHKLSGEINPKAGVSDVPPVSQ